MSERIDTACDTPTLTIPGRVEQVTVSIPVTAIVEALRCLADRLLQQETAEGEALAREAPDVP